MNIDQGTGVPDDARVHIYVSGRVQNVGFRAYVQRTGIQLALKGWVRNVSDDQVETVAEGSRQGLEEFIQRIKKGPDASRVEKAEVSWENFVGEYSRFSIRTSFG